MREFSRHAENSAQLARLEVPAREGRRSERFMTAASNRLPCASASRPDIRATKSTR